MVRKQSLANKQRSRKNRNKKRARTIRSMRQVNGGVKIMDTFKNFGRFGRFGRRDSLNESLLETPLVETGPSELILEPLLARLSVTDDEDFDIISKQEYNDTAFYNYLKKIFLKIVRLRVVDDTLKEYINNKTNKKKVVTQFVTQFKKIIHQKVIDTISNFTSEQATNLFDTTYANFEDFIKKIKNNTKLNSFKTTDLILFLNMLWNELSLFAKLKMTEMNMKMTNEYLMFVATHTFNEIFNNIETYLTDIKNEMDTLTAGGSKGKMKSKMSRRKSRTRKS